MPTVRIRDDIYKRITKLAVDTTINMQTPINQGAIIQMLLDLVKNIQNCGNGSRKTDHNRKIDATFQQHKIFTGVG